MGGGSSGAVAALAAVLGPAAPPVLNAFVTGPTADDVMLDFSLYTGTNLLFITFFSFDHFS
jgi:hypothetical protein